MAGEQGGVEAQRALAGRERLVEIAARLEHDREIVVGVGEVVAGGDRAAQQAARIVRAPEVEGRLATAGEALSVIGMDVEHPAVERIGFGVAAAAQVGLGEPQRLGGRDRPQARRRSGRRRRCRGLAPAGLTLLTATLCPVHDLPASAGRMRCRPGLW